MLTTSVFKKSKDFGCLQLLFHWFGELKAEHQNVTLLGANSIFGKMTSFLLKQSPYLDKLTLFDYKKIEVSDDIRYINTPCKVLFVDEKNNIGEAVKSADIVIIGDEWVNEISFESVFRARAPIISNCVQQIVCYNPNAIIVVATTPVNMTFPLVVETLKDLGNWNEKKLFGMTNVENMRAKCILANHLQVSPRKIDFPVIGGSSSETRVPLLSRISPRIQLSKKNLQKITCAIKTSETKPYNESTNQKSLNRAYATSMLIQSIVAALNGHEVVETVLSYQNVIKGTNYFSLPVVLGEEGIKKHISLPNISNHEKCLLSHAIKRMDADAKKAKYYSEKILENCIKIIPSNKLNNLKRHKEGNIEVKTPFLQSFPDKELNENLLSSKNLKSTEHINQAGSKTAHILDEVNSTIHNDIEIFSKIQNKSTSSENKLPASLNEEIVSEIDVTLGVSDVNAEHIKENANINEKQAHDYITCNKLEINCTDSPTESSSQKVNCSQSNLKNGGDDHLKSQSFIEPLETSQYNNSDKTFTKSVQKNKDLVYPLSRISPINKLNESGPPTSKSKTTNHKVNSGLENYNSLKQYHSEISCFRKNDNKDLDNINRNDSFLQLCKEQMGSLCFEIPHLNQITVTTNKAEKPKPGDKIYDNKLTEKNQSLKPPVTEWSCYVSLESHNVNNSNCNNNQQKQKDIHLNSQSDVDNKLESLVSLKKNNSNYSPENSKINCMPVKNIDTSQQISAFHQKIWSSTNQFTDDGFFENVLYKQNNVISCRLKHLSFINRMSNQSCYSPQSKPKFCFKQLENNTKKINQCEFLKLHLLTTKSESSKMIFRSKEISMKENNSNWKKKYFASIKNSSMAKFSSTVKKVKDENLYKTFNSFENKKQCNKENKFFNLPEVQVNKEKVEKNKCSQILNHNFSKDAVSNDEILSNCKNEIIISQPFMNFQKKKMSDVRKQKQKQTHQMYIKISHE